MTIKQNLSNPTVRQEILASIEPKDAKLYHELLKQIFCLEITDRSKKELFQGDRDYTENLYWCGFLLYHVGNLADVNTMWQAKQIDMDTNCGFDIQNLVGGGVETTIAYLIKNNSQEIADYLKFCQEQGDFEELDQWERFRYDYYYS